MRLTYEGMRFSGSLSDLKKYLEEKAREEEMRQVLEEKDKEDEKAMREHMFQGDNQSFSG